MPTLRLHRALIAVFAVAGMTLSGYLSWYNIWGEGCAEALLKCGAKPVEIFGVPNCVYGFFMFLAVFVTVAVSAGAPQSLRPWSVMAWLGLVGTLFAAGLTAYEIGWQNALSAGIPACVYGGLLYVGILFTALDGRKKLEAHLLPMKPVS